VSNNGACSAEVQTQQMKMLWQPGDFAAKSSGGEASMPIRNQIPRKDDGLLFAGRSADICGLSAISPPSAASGQADGRR
jgi:hypothetical protein